MSLMQLVDLTHGCLFPRWGVMRESSLPSVINEANERGYIIVAPLGLGGEEMGNYYSS